MFLLQGELLSLGLPLTLAVDQDLKPQTDHRHEQEQEHSKHQRFEWFAHRFGEPSAGFELRGITVENLCLYQAEAHLQHTRKHIKRRDKQVHQYLNFGTRDDRSVPDHQAEEDPIQNAIKTAAEQGQRRQERGV